MSFVDIRFLFFFPTVVILNILIPQRFRWVMLLIASYFFYMLWKPEYALLLLAITAVDFVAGIQMERATDDRVRKLYLFASLLFNLGTLFVFKYFNFFFSTIGDALHTLGVTGHLPMLSLLLPIGISFHIFQSLSYTIDVYTRRTKAVTHFGKFALFVSFFPQLVAGPIERPQHLLRQFFEDRPFSLDMAHRGAKLMAWGFFKKMVVADNLAPLVNAVYTAPADFTGPSLIIATVLFAYQLYCDFSGYTDIARGAALILGYDLVINFDRPYSATTVAEFWRRWHISLSSWLRDYVYLPLALRGKKHSRTKIYMSLFVTFTLIGLWHGANWTYVILGMLHGMYLIVGSATERFRKRVFHTPPFLKRVVVFGLVCFSWIFFRAPSLDTALYIATHLFSNIANFFGSLTTATGISHVITMSVPIQGTILGVAGIIVIEIVDMLRAHGTFAKITARIPHYVGIAFFSIALFVLLLTGAFSRPEQFIYFQF